MLMNELWAALIGALVGGAISGVAAWWTTKGQWAREHSARQRERLEDALLLATRAMTSEKVLARGNDLYVTLSPDSVRELHFARSFASGSSPRLAGLIEEWGLDGDKQWLTQRRLEDLRVFNGIVARWLKDPEAFEKQKESLNDLQFRAKLLDGK